MSELVIHPVACPDGLEHFVCFPFVRGMQGNLRIWVRHSESALPHEDGILHVRHTDHHVAVKGIYGMPQEGSVLVAHSREVMGQLLRQLTEGRESTVVPASRH